MKVLLFLLIISCSLLEKNSISDNKIKHSIKNSLWHSYKTEKKIPFKNGVYSMNMIPDEPNCASCIERGEITNIAIGELNESGKKEAVAIATISSGGSGVFIYLNYYVEKNGKMEQSGFPYFLGDRIIVNKVSIKNKKILISFIGHGSGEPLCCPSTKGIFEFVIKSGKLKKIK